MTDKNWTPGPWEVDHLPLGSAIVSRQPIDGELGTRVIANMALGTDGDAHMIAASRDMYAALETLVREARKTVQNGPSTEAAPLLDACINAEREMAKARGDG